METDNFAAAAVAVMLLGKGAYNLKEVGGEKEVPFFLFGRDPLDWFKTEFGEDFEGFISKSPAAIAAAFESVVVGSPRDRETFAEGLTLITDPAKRQRWVESWHDKRRSSMNDIGGNARKYAAHFRTLASQAS
jgi:hypothetical protein